MGLAIRRRKQCAGEQQHRVLESFVDDGMHRERRSGPGAQVIVDCPHQNAQRDQQQKLADVHAEGKERYRQTEREPQSGFQVPPQILQRLSRRRHCRHGDARL